MQAISMPRSMEVPDYRPAYLNRRGETRNGKGLTLSVGLQDTSRLLRSRLEGHVPRLLRHLNFPIKSHPPDACRMPHAFFGHEPPVTVQNYVSSLSI